MRTEAVALALPRSWALDLLREARDRHGAPELRVRAPSGPRAWPPSCPALRAGALRGRLSGGPAGALRRVRRFEGRLRLMSFEGTVEFGRDVRPLALGECGKMLTSVLAISLPPPAAWSATCVAHLQAAGARGSTRLWWELVSDSDERQMSRHGRSRIELPEAVPSSSHDVSAKPLAAMAGSSTIFALRHSNEAGQAWPGSGGGWALLAREAFELAGKGDAPELLWLRVALAVSLTIVMQDGPRGAGRRSSGCRRGSGGIARLKARWPISPGALQKS